MADDADRAQSAMERAMRQTLEEIRRQSQEESRRPECATADECDECGELIPSARQVALPGCRLCISCAEVFERRARGYRK
jgi:phage/conjugal plasmid C-4 type zinc finger TraR family protein